MHTEYSYKISLSVKVKQPNQKGCILNLSNNTQPNFSHRNYPILSRENPNVSWLCLCMMWGKGIQSTTWLSYPLAIKHFHTGYLEGRVFFIYLWYSTLKYTHQGKTRLWINHSLAKRNPINILKQKLWVCA